MSHSLPLVSIVIPVKNHEKYVEEALNSVLNQSYPDLEVIIIDDGSEDDSVDRIEKWIEKTGQIKKPGYHFTLIKLENKGIPAAINRGLSIARGDFLTILNSDDIYNVHRIEALVRRVTEEQGELAISAIKGIDHHGLPLSVGHPWREKYEEALHDFTLSPTIGFQVLKHNMSQAAGNLFFSRNIYQRIGEFNNLKVLYDYDFLLRAILITEPIFLNTELFLYRFHENKAAVKESHVVQIELNDIYKEYLFQISLHPPANRQAPCHWYWPLAFPLVRSKIKMDRGLSAYFTRPSSEVNNKIDANLNKDNNLLQYHRKQPKAKRQKISLITHELSLTGAPKVVADLALSFKERGYTVNVISLFDGPMRKELERHQIPLYVLPNKIAVNMLFNPKLYKKIVCNLLVMMTLLFKLNRITIGNTCVPGELMSYLSLLNPFYRLIWYIHDSSPPSALLRIDRKIKSLFNRAQRNPRFERWFGSKNTQEIWQSSELGGKTMYWSGIPACHALTHPSPKPMTEILSVGTSSPRKGTHYLIEAFMIGVKEGLINHDVNLTIIGFYEDFNLFYEYTGDLVLQVTHSDLKDRIRLIPNLQPDLLETYYQKADLYVQSSTQECLPLALFQAMSKGIPIVTTNVNGCAEVIENDKTGYVCHPRNSRLLLKAILKALNNPEKSHTMALEAQKLFNEKFCLEKNLEEVLRQLNLNDAKST